jgi:hypothetical protein
MNLSRHYSHGYPKPKLKLILQPTGSRLRPGRGLIRVHRRGGLCYQPVRLRRRGGRQSGQFLSGRNTRLTPVTPGSERVDGPGHGALSAYQLP